MTVSVVLPTIPSRGMMLSRAITSVTNQTLPAEDIIVPVDYRKDGAGPTRNRGAAAASSEWLAFLDDDDQMCHSHLEDLVDHAEETGADMVYPWFTTVGVSQSALRVPVDGVLTSPEGVPFGDEQRDYVGRGPQGHGNNFIPITYLIRRELFMDLGGFPTTNTDEWPHPANEDWGFLIKLCASGASIEHLDARTWIWHFHSGSTLGGGRG